MQLKQYSLKTVAISLFGLLFLSACGGGGGGDNGGDQTPTPGATNVAPVANAGTDQTVNEQTQVTLSAAGTDSDGSVVSFSWAQLSGPSVSLPNIGSGTTISAGGSVNTLFTAPTVTGFGNSVSLVFELTVTDDDGATATDQLSVVVNAVNASPQANVSADQTVEEAEVVTLTGNSIDSDGTISTYAWTQTAGTTVAITNSDQASASFTAPATATRETLSFSLTVTDNEGATNTGSVDIEVISVDTPDLSVTFPPPAGSYTTSDIDVFGTTLAKGGATISTVSVTTDLGTTNALVTGGTTWRAANVAVPTGVANFTMTVEVTDTSGLTRSAVSNLTTNATNGTGNVIANSVNGVTIDSDSNTAYISTTGSFVGDFVLYTVDLLTGNRIDTLTDNSNAAQGVALDLPTGIVLDKANNRIVGTDNGLDAIFAIDLTSGQRTILSDSTTGTGTNFNSVFDISLDSLSQDVYLVDNAENRIFSVDISGGVNSGDRTVVADSTTTAFGISAPIAVAFDSNNDQLLLVENLQPDTPLLAIDLSVVTPTISVISSDANGMGTELDTGIFGLALNQASTLAYVLQTDGEVLSVDLASGNRALVTDIDFAGSNTIKQNDIEYDNSTSLLYAAGQPNTASNNALAVIDPQSGDSVIISQ